MRAPILIGVAAVVLLVSGSASALVGVGMAVGEPSGVDLRYWSGGHSGFDLGVGWSFQRFGGFYVHGDYLYSGATGSAKERDGLLHYYGGAGVWVQFKHLHGSELGLRIPLGVDYVLSGGRYDVFAEVAPGIGTTFVFYGRVGVRYRF